jgi:hypothetical protein
VSACARQLVWIEIEQLPIRQLKQLLRALNRGRLPAPVGKGGFHRTTYETARYGNGWHPTDAGAVLAWLRAHEIPISE